MGITYGLTRESRAAFWHVAVDPQVGTLRCHPTLVAIRIYHRVSIIIV
jgi:hypothetical protein